MGNKGFTLLEVDWSHDFFCEKIIQVLMQYKKYGNFRKVKSVKIGEPEISSGIAVILANAFHAVSR